jgi:MYXO-CTERM domain-containing protein
VSLLGSNWSIPIVDIPFPFPITQNPWVFASQRVHMPLPDLALSDQVLDFGELMVGEKKTLPYQLWNAGEAKVAATMTTSDAITFPLFVTSATVAPGLTQQASVEFIPPKAGVFAGQIAVTSNDPNAPVQLILVKGSAKATPMATPPPPTTHETPEAAEMGNCACRAAGEPAESGGRASGLGALALVATALLRRRRRG